MGQLSGRLCALILALAVPAVALAGPGDLDLTFGDHGVVVTDLTGGKDFGNSMLIQPDGRIVVAGTVDFQGPDSDFGLARYLGDGALDASFGVAGLVTTDLSGSVDDLYGLTIQADGKLVAVGDSYQSGTGLDHAVVRYLPDGSLDASFGSGGVALTDFGTAFDSARRVAIQADGKIVVLGTAGLVRYDAAGALDGTFGVGGVAPADLGMMLLESDGRILVARPGLVTRYGVDGSVDGSIPISLISVTAAALQADGKMLIAGSDAGAIKVVRHHPGGSIDDAFGSGGTATIDTSSADDVARSIASESDGRIVVGGGSFGLLTVFRLEADGTVETGFGGTPVPGATFLPFDVAGHAQAEGLAIQPDGRIVAAGSTQDGTDWRFLVVRLALATCGNGAEEPGEVCEDGNLTDGDDCDSNCTPTGCGNDIRTGSEQCDDGNQADGDCCAADCQIPACPRLAQKALFSLARGGTSDKLQFKWLRGDPTTYAELGTPTATTPYALCVRAGGALVVDARVAPAGTCDDKPCWKSLSTKGYKFLDKSQRNDGITQLILKGSATAKSLVKVKGEGQALNLFSILPLAEPVRVQVVNGDTGLCFESSFAGSQIDTSDATQFKAQAP